MMKEYILILFCVFYCVPPSATVNVNNYLNHTFILLPNQFVQGHSQEIAIRTTNPNTKVTFVLTIENSNFSIKHDQIYSVEALSTYTEHTRIVTTTDLKNTTIPMWYGTDFQYEIPFSFDFQNKLTVNFEFSIIFCIDNTCAISTNATIVKSVIILRPSLIILSETDKPIYQPGELVRFRYLAIDAYNLEIEANTSLKKLVKDSASGTYQLKPIEGNQFSTLVFNEIKLFNPDGEAIKQWFNVTPIEASNMKFDLITDSMEGIYRIESSINDQVDTLSFTVKKYVLPAYLISITKPENLTFNSAFIDFTVCAKYTNGKVMSSATVRVLSCICDDYQIENFRSFEKQSEIFQNGTCPKKRFYPHYLKVRPCIKAEQILERVTGCTRFNLSTDIYQLRSNSETEIYSRWNQIPLLCAEIEEHGTKSRFTKCERGVTIQDEHIQLQLEFPSVFHVNLPIRGKIKLVSTINPGSSVNRTVHFSVMKWKMSCYWMADRGPITYFYNSMLQTNELGEIEVIVPPVKQRFPLMLKATLIDEQVDKQKVEPTAKMSPHASIIGPRRRDDGKGTVVAQSLIEPWVSMSPTEVQLWSSTSGKVQANACPGSVKIKLLSNAPLSDKILYLKSWTLGRTLSIMIPPSDYPMSDYQCVDRDDYLGHFKCNKDKYSTNITCDPGWSDVNCLKPICSPGCNIEKGGGCIKPNQCECTPGWRGHNCNECVKRAGCMNGKCVNGNDCVCDPEWWGYNCDRKSVQYEDVPLTAALPGRSELSRTKRDYEENQSQRTFYERDIEFIVDGKWGPKATVVLYYFAINNQSNYDIVATSFALEGMNDCLSPAIALQASSHEKSIFFDQKIADPGQKLNLTILPKGVRQSAGSAEPEICYVKISDSALSHFEGDRSTIDLNLFSGMLTEYIDRNSDRPYLVRSNQDAFKAAGFILATHHDETVVRFDPIPCPLFSMARSFPRMNNDKVLFDLEAEPFVADIPVKARLRDFFPEIWLFETYPIEEVYTRNKTEKGVQLQLTVPDSITTWRASAFCSTDKNGLWIGTADTVTVVMPLFVEITTPKEIKRGEIAYIPISVSLIDQTRDTRCYEVSVRTDVDERDWLRVGVEQYTGCVCENEKLTFDLGLMPRHLGKLNVTAEALAQSNSLICNPTMTEYLLFQQSSVNSTKNHILTDRIRRSINVVSEGVPVEETFGDIICVPNNSYQVIQKLPINIPAEIIHDSLRAYLSFTDQVMGPALINLDQLVRLPTGCGEQNMVLIAPNVYVLGYLKRTNLNKMNDKLIQKAKMHIVKGYQNQLKYRRDDGSFSAFGKSDETGSTWLTAFVLRVFAKAYRLEPSLNIDWNSLFDNSLKFLNQQQDNQSGCFNEHGRVLHTGMQGGYGSAKLDLKTLLLTSYVSSALNAIEIKRNETTLLIQKALNCIMKKINNFSDNSQLLGNFSTYHLAQLTYSQTLLEPFSKMTHQLQNELWNRRVSSSDRIGPKIYWPSENLQSDYVETSTNSQDIETTAYAYLTFSTTTHLNSELFPIIRYLSTKQKSSGGFYSTQDTILGLESLADFGNRLGLEQTSTGAGGEFQLTAKLEPANYVHSELITVDKRQVVNQVELPFIDVNQLKMTTWLLNVTNPQLKTCMSVQTVLLYNLPEAVKSTKNLFDLTIGIQQVKVPNKSACLNANLTVCIKLNPAHKDFDGTGMLLVKISTLTGWAPLMELMQLQLGTSENSSRRIELNENENEISIYFNGFTKSEAEKLGGLHKLKRCVHVPFKQMSYTKDLKPGFVTAMDYYVTEKSITKPYRLDDCRDVWNIQIVPNQSIDPTAYTTETPLTTITNSCPKCSLTAEGATEFSQLYYQSLCTSLNNVFLLRLFDEICDESCNATITMVQNSRAIFSWNTTLRLTYIDAPSSSSKICPCYSVKQKNKYLMLLNIKPMDLRLGDPFVDLTSHMTKNAPNILLPVKDILSDLKTATDIWLNLLSTVKPDVLLSKEYEQAKLTCGRLPVLLNYIQTKFTLT